MRLGGRAAQPRATAVRGYTSTEYSDWHTTPRNARTPTGGDRLSKRGPAFLGPVCQSQYLVLVYPRTAVAVPVRVLPCAPFDFAQGRQDDDTIATTPSAHDSTGARAAARAAESEAECHRSPRRWRARSPACACPGSRRPRPDWRG